ncbi:MAG: hypothetical protein AAGI07_01075 [Bacteroidota bacterium]
MRNSHILSLFVAALFITQCSKIEYNNVQTKYTNASAKGFNDYWYKGLAELNSFDLEQVRYGQVHKGEAILIFVTEDFSKSKQVKLDNPSANTEDSIKVLKLNFTKNFLTGIYPYSLMMSVFTPVNQQKFPHTLKVSTTAQDWCGHAFSQLNYQKNGFQFMGNSYFESEGDQQYKIKKALLEDELWNMIRLNPENLPKGDIEIIPGSFFSRLRHRKTEIVKAKATLTETDDALHTYTLDYPALNRQLSITFQKDFPHQVTAFEETHMSSYGANAQQLTTRATRKETIMLDYWNKHFNQDRKYRQDLGLGM